MDLNEMIERYHAALDEFSRGDPEPVKTIFSHRGDVTLANPFGPAVCGWQTASSALDYASSRFRGGSAKTFERVASFISADLATIHETERWSTKFAGSEEISTFDLRVTSTFRREDGEWRLVHRHADPIAAADPRGPLRNFGN